MCTSLKSVTEPAGGCMHLGAYIYWHVSLLVLEVRMHVCDVCMYVGMSLWFCALVVSKCEHMGPRLRLHLLHADPIIAKFQWKHCSVTRSSLVLVMRCHFWDVDLWFKNSKRYRKHNFSCTFHAVVAHVSINSWIHETFSLWICHKKCSTIWFLPNSSVRWLVFKPALSSPYGSEYKIYSVYLEVSPAEHRWTYFQIRVHKKIVIDSIAIVELYQLHCQLSNIPSLFSQLVGFTLHLTIPSV